MIVILKCHLLCIDITVYCMYIVYWFMHIHSLVIGLLDTYCILRYSLIPNPSIIKLVINQPLPCFENILHRNKNMTFRNQTCPNWAAVLVQLILSLLNSILFVIMHCSLHCRVIAFFLILFLVCPWETIGRKASLISFAQDPEPNKLDKQTTKKQHN